MRECKLLALCRESRGAISGTAPLFKVESLKKIFRPSCKSQAASSSRLKRFERLELVEHPLKGAASFDSFAHLTVGDRWVETPLAGISVEGAGLGHF